MHPFPSILDALAAGAIAIVAGAAPDVALRLGLGMAFVQFSIGTANDLVDAPLDALVRTGKPLPSGLLTRRQALAAFGLCAATGLAAAWSVGGAALVLALVGLGDGLLYDLKLKGTALSWLPFAVGVALVPIYGWWAPTGRWSLGLSALTALALLAGVSLAIGNALADMERDERANVRSIARALGRDRARGINALLTAALLAVVLAAGLSPGPSAAAITLMLTGAAAASVGLVLTFAQAAAARQADWEAQAVGYALLGTGWLWALAGSGALGAGAG